MKNDASSLGEKKPRSFRIKDNVEFKIDKVLLDTESC